MPLVGVLANPAGAPVDLSVSHLLAALYGNPQWAMTIDSQSGAAVDEGRLELGRDGKLTNDHPYLGAIVLLRRRELAQDAAEKILAERKGRSTDAPKTARERRERMAAAFDELSRHELPDGHYFWADVIETTSEAAVRLPEDWFDGDLDRRWRCNQQGRYELIRGRADPRNGTES